MILNKYISAKIEMISGLSRKKCDKSTILFLADQKLTIRIVDKCGFDISQAYGSGGQTLTYLCKSNMDFSEATISA